MSQFEHKQLVADVVALQCQVPVHFPFYCYILLNRWFSILWSKVTAMLPLPCPYSNRIITITIPLARILSQRHMKLQGRLGNVVPGCIATESQPAVSAFLELFVGLSWIIWVPSYEMSLGTDPLHNIQLRHQ